MGFEMLDKIRDLRIKEKFSIDDAYLNGYARVCGLNATGVYVSLCRHVDKNQFCFPGKSLIAEELSISERSVYTGLKELEKWDIIKIQKQERRKRGIYGNNTYILLDKSVWKPLSPKGVSHNRRKYIPTADIADGTKCLLPQANNNIDRRQLLPDKETHMKETHIKDKDPAFDFEQLWQRYPIKIGRKEAERHFKTSVKTEEDWKNINRALTNYVTSKRVKEGYIQNGSTWFNNWKDWINYREQIGPKLTPAQEHSKYSIEKFAEKHDVR